MFAVVEVDLQLKVTFADGEAVGDPPKGSVTLQGCIFGQILVVVQADGFHSGIEHGTCGIHRQGETVTVIAVLFLREAVVVKGKLKGFCEGDMGIVEAEGPVPVGRIEGLGLAVLS